MTTIRYTRNYVTQEQLDRAYRRLGHTSTERAWSAVLLIDADLNMTWACPVLASAEAQEEDYPYPARHNWHVIAVAGELDWPPLRPEAEIWPALLERQPVPTGEHAERQARALGMSIEEAHRDRLRRHFLGDAHIAGSIKRNPTDVNFDPIVRDWDATARELADFIDGHRPPKLTTEQRVMAQGVHLAELEAETARTKASLGHLMRNARREQGPTARRGFKSDLSRWSGVTRPTVEAWLADGGCCEGAVPDEDDAARPTHTHATDTQEHNR